MEEKLEKKYTKPPNFDVNESFKDSNVKTPLIFVITPGSDPFEDWINLARKLNFEPVAISLGQGQGPKAKTLFGK